MAAMLNALAILIGVVWVIWEAAKRFQSPVEVPGLAILIVALVGIGVNTGSALLFLRAQKDDLNAKGALLHNLTDAAVSGAVVLAAAGIHSGRSTRPSRRIIYKTRIVVILTS